LTRIIFAWVFLMVGVLTAQDSSWEVPSEFRGMANPIAATPDAIALGEGLYKQNCERCHGERGLGDGPATKFIRPAPKEIASADAQARMSDGEIFFKISEGKRPMPPMKTTLSEEDRWRIVHFVRTLRQP
jgi:mono/diheme cytochrome c family protein